MLSSSANKLKRPTPQKGAQARVDSSRCFCQNITAGRNNEDKTGASRIKIIVYAFSTKLSTYIISMHSFCWFDYYSFFATAAVAMATEFLERRLRHQFPDLKIMALCYCNSVV
ncbi:hypothetical protein NC651_015821 [Populus alba x Populus x berolinensis]|nr:hypothetical protein NC651_015821 [Populus alba x Populus x berolinensis]